MKMTAYFVCRNRAAEAERSLAQLGDVRWRMVEGGLIDDGVVGPVACDSGAPPEDRDCAPPGRQPVQLVVEATRQEAADEIGAILHKNGAVRVLQ